MTSFKWGMTAAIGAFIISAVLGLLFGVGLFHVLIRALIFAGVFFALGFGLRFVINSFLPELLFNEEDIVPSYDFAEPEQRVNITMDSAGEYAVPELYKTSGDSEEMGNIEDLISGAFKPRRDSSEGIDQRMEGGYNRGSIGSYSSEDAEEAHIDFGDVSSPLLEAVAAPQMSSRSKASQGEASQEDASRAPQPSFTPGFGDDSGGLGGLPDLDMMAMAFSTGGAIPGFSGAPVPPPASKPASASGPDVDFGGLPDLGAASGAEQAFFQPDTFEPMEPVAAYKGNKPQPLQGDYNPKELAEGIRTVLRKENK